MPGAATACVRFAGRWRRGIINRTPTPERIRTVPSPTALGLLSSPWTANCRRNTNCGDWISGRAIVLTVDLADFFPSTAARRIRAWFRAQGWQDAALETLMRLCVYRGGLPQGAPTSPALSNLVNLPLDEKLSELTTLEGGRYSRYCDDPAFSWPQSAEPAAFRLRVEDRLRHFGYRIQESKGWALQRADQRPEITGVLLDGRRLRLPRRIVTRLRRVLTDRRTNPTTKAAQLQGYKGLRDMLK